MSCHITSALKFKALPRCHLGPTKRPPACSLQLHTRDDLLHICCQKGVRAMLLTTAQPPSTLSSSSPSLHRAFSFVSQYSDESSTVLLHSTCSTQMHPAQVQWQHCDHTMARHTFSPSGCQDQLTFLQSLYFRISVGGT